MLAFNTSNAQNLVANPGFESGTNDWFTIGGSFAISGGGRSGAACAAIGLPNGFASGIAQFMGDKLKPGHSYVWSAWLRVSPAVPPPPRTVRFNLRYTDQSTNYVRPLLSVDLTTTWTLASVAFDFTASKTTSNVLIAIDGFSPTAGFSFFLDDVSITNSSPLLAIERTNNSVVISWPSTPAGYSLERKSTFIAPGWTAVTDPVQTNGNVLSVTLSPTNVSRFYRLKK